MRTKNITKLKNNFWFKAAFVLALGLALVVIFSAIVPYNMDEFIHFSNLSCLFYKYNGLNSFREACGGYDLFDPIFHASLPIRTFAYSGSFGSLYYLPFFLLWRNPISARFAGMFFLILEAFLLSKAFNFKFRWSWIFLLLFFPYFYQHLADTGPVGFQIFTVIAIYFLERKWLENAKLRYPLTIVLLLFLAIWIKPVFVWLVPGILFYTLTEFYLNWRTIKPKIETYLWQFGLAIMIFAAAMYYFLSFRDMGGHYAWLEIAKGAKGRPLDFLLDINSLRTSRLYSSLVNPLEATQRAFEVIKPNFLSKSYGLVFYILTPLLLTIFYGIKKEKNFLLRSAAFFLGFIASEFFAFRSVDSWAMHHFVLGLSFLALGYGLFLSYFLKKQFSRKLKTFFYLLIGLFIILNTYYFVIFPTQSVQSWDDRSKIKVNKVLSDPVLAQNYFYIVVDWGMYYYQALYGDINQSVLYLEPFNQKEQLTEIYDLTSQYKRKIAIIYRENTASFDNPVIQSITGLEECKLIDDDSVWKIKLQGSAGDNICL